MHEHTYTYDKLGKMRLCVLFLLHSMVHTTNVNLNILFTTFNSWQLKYNGHETSEGRKNLGFAVRSVDYLLFPENVYTILRTGNNNIYGVRILKRGILKAADKNVLKLGTSSENVPSNMRTILRFRCPAHAQSIIKALALHKYSL